MKTNMGQAIGGIFKALSCDSMAKYVCNSMDLKSSCSECCEFEVHTAEVEVADSASEFSIDVEGCCATRSK